MEKKVYEEPSVVKVELDFSERIAASGCLLIDSGCYFSGGVNNPT